MWYTGTLWLYTIAYWDKIYLSQLENVFCRTFSLSTLFDFSATLLDLALSVPCCPPNPWSKGICIRGISSSVLESWRPVCCTEIEEDIEIDCNNSKQLVEWREKKCFSHSLLYKNATQIFRQFPASAIFARVLRSSVLTHPMASVARYICPFPEKYLKWKQRWRGTGAWQYLRPIKSFWLPSMFTATGKSCCAPTSGWGVICGV